MSNIYNLDLLVFSLMSLNHLSTKRVLNVSLSKVSKCQEGRRPLEKMSLSVIKIESPQSTEKSFNETYVIS